VSREQAGAGRTDHRATIDSAASQYRGVAAGRRVVRKRLRRADGRHGGVPRRPGWGYRCGRVSGEPPTQLAIFQHVWYVFWL